jgi:hypothetical protein
MLHKAIVAASILLLMTAAVSAQMSTPAVHLKDDKPSRTKEQKKYDKELDRAYQSAIKKISSRSTWRRFMTTAFSKLEMPSLRMG